MRVNIIYAVYHVKVIQRMVASMYWFADCGHRPYHHCHHHRPLIQLQYKPIDGQSLIHMRGLRLRTVAETRNWYVQIFQAARDPFSPL